MADFTPAQIGQRVESAPVGGGGVQEPSALVSGLSLLSSLAPSGAQLEARREAQRELQAASVVDQFSQESLRIADAVDRGEMTSAQGRMRQRALFSSYTSNNPLLRGDITKAHEGIVKTVGMGKVLVEGNEQEQQQRAIIQEAINRKWITADMSREEQLAGAARLREFDLEQELIKAMAAKQSLLNSQLTEQSSRLSISNAQIEQQRKLIGLEMDSAKLRAMNSAYEMANSYSPANVSQLQSILDRAEGAGPDVRRSLMAELDNLEATTISQVQRGLGPAGTSDQVSGVLRPYKLRFDSARDILNGTTERSSWENAIAISQAQEKHNLLLDPATRTAVAVTGLFGEQVVLSSKISSQALTAYTNAISGQQPNVVPLPVDSTGIKNTQEYLDSVRAIANASNHQQLTEQSMQELQANVDAVMGSVADAYRRPATSFNSVAQALASPEMGEYIKQNGSILTTENALAAKEVLREQYAEVVLPMIQDEWQTTYKDFVVSGEELERRGIVPSNLRASEDKPVQGNVRVDFSGGGVVFRATGSMSGLGRAKLNRLNQQMAPVINNLIRLGAHLDGNTDYRKFYEDNYASIFDTAGTPAEQVE